MSGGRRRVLRAVLVGGFLACFALGDCAISARQPAVTLPSTPLKFGFFTARFGPARMFTLEGEGWPPFKGTWKFDSAAIVLSTPACAAATRPGATACRDHATSLRPSSPTTAGRAG